MAVVNRPRILDLFCGAGGAAMGYHRAGFDVVGVDIAPHFDFPFPMIVGDALEILRNPPAWLGHFDAIHASPPCQRYSTATGSNRDKHPDLIGPVRELLEASGLPYIIENVPQAPLRDPATLCGSMFGLMVRRHRAFETSFPIHRDPVCHHSEQGRPVGVYGQHPDRKQHLRPDGTQRGTKATSLGHGQRAMGIDWMEWSDLVEAIPPAYTEYIGRQLIEHMQEASA